MRYDLRLTEDEFWALTPKRMLALGERRFEERRWWSSRFFALVLASGATKKGGGQLRPADVFSELGD